ncbi:MAG: hypothetical protein QOD75_2036 [Blastocatellia bacterium]|jgi:hypothetical protein|nr:hypothetical protein [Blastocatellia bacterium]
MKPQLAEMLLDLKFHGSPDRFRQTHPFSEDIEAAHAILFNPRYNKWKKLNTYRKWVATGQPCLFGKAAAKTKSVFICMLEEHELLRMKRGDEDLRDTIQDHRQAWKRYALEGSYSSFMVLLLSQSLVTKEPGDKLKEICRRLLELYMEVEPIDDDMIVPQREYVFLRTGPQTFLKFGTLPNVFCAQGDGRWWHDHRTPGGIMITSNALGHFELTRAGSSEITIKEKTHGLDNAMRTIKNAYGNEKKIKGLTHCPATRLVAREQKEEPPIREASDLHPYSPSHYHGFFHTDHLVPSVFFSKERDPKLIPEYDDLSFRYIYDPIGDPDDHKELMTGEKATAYEVKRNMDRLPDFLDPEIPLKFTSKFDGRIGRWLADRIAQRLVS